MNVIENSLKEELSCDLICLLKVKNFRTVVVN